MSSSRSASWCSGPSPQASWRAHSPLRGEGRHGQGYGVTGYRVGWPGAALLQLVPTPCALCALAAVSKPEPRARAARHLGAAPGRGRAKPPSPNRFWFRSPLEASDPAGGGGGEHSLGGKKGGPLWGSVSAPDLEAQGTGVQCVSGLGKTPLPVASSIKREY